MNYTPKQQNKYVTAIVVTLIVVGIGVYMLPAFLPIRAIFCQAAAMICLVAAVFILVRYKTTAFIYAVRPRSLMQDDIDAEAALAGGHLSVWHMEPRYLDFVVSKKQGSRAPGMECVLGLDCLTAAWDISPEGKFKKPGDASSKAREMYGEVAFYDYTVTLGLARSLLLLFRDGDKYAAIRIEPDGDLRNYLVGVAEKNGKKEEIE
ncbi:MAG: hypothetical protein E7638_07280 [Ruminococcaceae bacterium]|nr:hypothetical protein [Oscillospiraceae bacterium]